MKFKTKIIKLWVMFSIALFLFIPLLSSTVVADVTYDTWAITNNNNNSVPAVWVGNTTIQTSFKDSGMVVITATCSTSGTDASSNPQQPSSRHFVNLTIQRISPSTGPLKFDCNTVYLNSNQNYGPTILQVTDSYYLSSGSEIIWRIIVDAECEDIPSTVTDEEIENWDISVTE